jgi:tetratricopeptide (TPR) repeat protein
VKFPLLALWIGYSLLLPAKEYAAQRPDPGVQPGATAPGVQAPGLEVNGQHISDQHFCMENLACAAVEIEVKGEDGMPLDGPVTVSLIKQNGQVFMTATAHGGKVSFGDVPKSALTVQVVAPGFQTAKKGFEVLDRAGVQVKIDLQPMADKEQAALAVGISSLSPKAQKDIGKALEALRVNRPVEARTHLEAAEREAPQSAEVEYLFGVYASQLNDQARAQSYWTKALQLNPRHLNALLALSQSFLQERKAAEAKPYLIRALDVEPSSWRTHMLMAQADLFEGDAHGAVVQAERALELGTRKRRRCNRYSLTRCIKAASKNGPSIFCRPMSPPIPVTRMPPNCSRD